MLSAFKKWIEKLIFILVVRTAASESLKLTQLFQMFKIYIKQCYCVV